MKSIEEALEQFSTRFEIILRTRNMSTGSIAKKVGINKNMATKYRCGAAEPRLVTLQSITQHLNLSKDELWFLVMGDEKEQRKKELEVLIEQVEYTLEQLGREK